MSAVNLDGEFWSALHHPDKHTLLAPLNLGLETVFDTGVARISPESDGLYVPDDEGSVIAAIWAVMPNSESIIDLAAIDTAHPKRCWQRTGLGSLLGEPNIAGLGIGDEPLLVHPGPYEWGLADGHGVAVLEYTPNTCGLLDSIPGGLEVEEGYIDFAESLERRLSVQGFHPRIYIRRRQRAA